MTEVPCVDEVVEFYYPVLNEIGKRRRTEKRRVKVESIRDLVKEPLTLADIIRRPFVRRGRFLVTGLDLDKGSRRSFYLGWNLIRRLVVLHSDGTPTKIASGKSRFEASCFAEMCARLPSDRDMKVTIKQVA